MQEGRPSILFCHSKLFVLYIYIYISTCELMPCVVVMQGLRLMMKIQQWWTLSGLMIGYTLTIKLSCSYFVLFKCISICAKKEKRKEKKELLLTLSGWTLVLFICSNISFVDFSLYWYCSSVYLDVVCLVVYAKNNAFKPTPFPSKLLYNLI